MYDENNIFAKILRSEISCNKVYENNIALFFYDINPIAKIHVLGIPKIKCINFDDFINKAKDDEVINFFNSTTKVISILGLNKDGYRIISNTGSDGGQEVPHYHIHIIGGERLGSKIN